MSDRERETESAQAGRSGGAEATPGLRSAEAQSATEPAPNVVPFPGSWFGGVEELVPITDGEFDPRPTRLVSVQVDTTERQQRNQAAAKPALQTVEPARPESAIDFWGGGRLELNDSHVVGGEHNGDEAISAPSGLGRTRRAAQRTADGASGTVRRAPSEARETSPRVRRRLPPLLGAIPLGLAALSTGILAALALNQHGPGKRSALVVTQTVPRTTTVVRTVATGLPATSRHPTGGHERRVHPARPTQTAIAPSGVGPAAPTNRAVGDTSRATGSTAPAAMPPVAESGASGRPGASGNASIPSGGRSTGSSIRSPTTPRSESKPRCAPSVTNGGACSL